MPLSRRAFVKSAAFAGLAGALGAATARVRGASHDQHSQAADKVRAMSSHTTGHGGNGVVGTTRTDDFDPYAFLSDFDYGKVVEERADGSKVREYTIVAEDKEIEIAPGIMFPAWTFNGQVPGPTLRATEGDHIRIHFINNGTHPHTLHFHGIHDDVMDGVPGVGVGEIAPFGGEFTYEFEAEPHGVHLYHCHALPLKRHMHKGLYGAYIVDPKDGWATGDANEMTMVMNAFDTTFDGENEVYAVNSKAFCYQHKPIRIKVGELQRIFLVNATEFDPVNSFHLHANFFNYWPIGHESNTPTFTDIVSLIQADRGRLEFKFDRPGKFMFHAHQAEFTELGWMGHFEVVP